MTKKKEEEEKHTDAVTQKAKLLNKQFQSVFSCLISPLRLGQLCTQTIQSLFHDNLPDNLKSSCPSMPEINIDLNEVLKLLSKLNPGKAAGPDLIKPIVLRVEIAHVICLLFERSFQTGQLPVLDPPFFRLCINDLPANIQRGGSQMMIHHTVVLYVEQSRMAVA